MSEAEPTASSVPPEEEADIAAMLDLSKKKKKGKKKKESKKDSKEKSEKKSESTEDGEDVADESAMEDQKARLAEEIEAFDKEFADEHDRKAEYSYNDLLDRVMDILTSNNPDLITKKRRVMKPPQLTRVGTKKTLWVNYQEICTMMQRPAEHVFQFFMAELGTEGSIDGSQRLVIRGKYVPKYIESLLRKYIVEYVTCQMCRSPNTELTKDSSTRLQFVNCKDCGSNRSVAAIRTGYHATSRADRRAARNAKG
jgi:translation initiation factor 2 subunit 2